MNLNERNEINILKLYILSGKGRRRTERADGVAKKGSAPEGARRRREDAERRRILRSAEETRGPVRVTANLRVLRLRTHRPPPPGRPLAMPSEKGRDEGGGTRGAGRRWSGGKPLSA